MTSTRRPVCHHPGRAFVERYGSPHTVEDVLRYADFLRTEAGVDDQPPVDLTLIFQHFGITSRRAPLIDQQGVLLDSDNGIILINQDDPLARQRFTEAHELMEFLFEVQEEASGWSGPRRRFDGYLKEQLCEQGAAALLMPQASFVPLVRKLGVSMETGSSLANLYQTSFLATLFQMVRLGPGAHALVIWRYALKPTQVQRLPAQEQMSLFGSGFVASPQKELRVWWATCTQGLTKGFVPKHKSIPRDSLIFYARETRLPQSGVEYVSLGRVQGHCLVEARPVTIGDECCVLSLLHLPGDSECRKF